MVLNLLDNAIRHTPARLLRRTAACARSGGEAVVEVADDGPGIPAAMRTQVFDRFVRGTGPADTARGTGTGLGLAIVSAVAESHGGSVEAGRIEGRRRPLRRPHPPAPTRSENRHETFKGALERRLIFPADETHCPPELLPRIAPAGFFVGGLRHKKRRPTLAGRLSASSSDLA